MNKRFNQKTPSDEDLDVIESINNQETNEG
jgi:hypothetical protein